MLGHLCVLVSCCRVFEDVGGGANQKRSVLDIGSTFIGSCRKPERVGKRTPLRARHHRRRTEAFQQSGCCPAHVVGDHDGVRVLHIIDGNAMSEPTPPPLSPIPLDPVPLPATPWQFPDPSTADEDGVVGLGADLAPETLIHAYRSGIFPMPVGRGDQIAWWSPPLRGVLAFEDLKISRSLRRSCRRYEITANVAFEEVMLRCAVLPREGGWISQSMIDAYTRLHELGYAHSVEAWQDDELVGGLYGIQIGGLFAGESMFHTATDASKVALVALVSGLEACGVTLLDVQWKTTHLATLGVDEITRSEYLSLLSAAVASEAKSFAHLSGRNSLSRAAQFLDRIRWEPTGGNP